MGLSHNALIHNLLAPPLYAFQSPPSCTTCSRRLPAPHSVGGDVGGVDVVHGVLVFAGYADFVVEVIGCGAACATACAQDVATFDALASVDLDLIHVAVAGFVVFVVDLDHFAVAVIPTCEGDDSVC